MKIPPFRLAAINSNDSDRSKIIKKSR